MCKANFFNYEKKTDERTILLRVAPMHIDEQLETKDQIAIFGDIRTRQINKRGQPQEPHPPYFWRRVALAAALLLK